MQRDDGLWYWAEYETFSISDEDDKYRLSVNGYRGDAGDALAAQADPVWISNGMMFSAQVSDNDLHPTYNCGFNDGWW